MEENYDWQPDGWIETLQFLESCLVNFVYFWDYYSKVSRLISLSFVVIMQYGNQVVEDKRGISLIFFKLW